MERLMGGMGRCASLVCTLICLAACSPLRVPIGPTDPFTVHLPLEQAGLSDARRDFATAFSRELQAAGEEPRASNWLHNVGDVPTSGADATPALASARGISVLIVPGIFGDCVADQSLPFSDGMVRPIPANYTEGYARYAALGFAGIRALQVPGRASSAANAPLIALQIEKEAARAEVSTIILIGYSKGVPDTLEALELLRARGGVPAKVRALVSVAGIVMGTPIADAHESLHNTAAPYLAPLECSESQGAEVSSLTYRLRTEWLDKHPIAQGIKLFSVVAHTNAGEVAPGLRAFNRELSSIDPRNDGQTIAGWSVLPRSTLLAQVRSDHWTFILPLDRHPNRLVRMMASSAHFPREQFFAALLKSVVRSTGTETRH